MRSAKKKPARKKATTRKVAVRPGAKAWTAAETAKLKKAYKTNSASEIAKMLKRSISSVKAKIRTLGLKKPNWRKAAAKKTTTKKATTRKKAATKKKAAPKKRVVKKAATKRAPKKKATAKKKRRY